MGSIPLWSPPPEFLRLCVFLFMLSVVSYMHECTNIHNESHCDQNELINHCSLFHLKWFKQWIHPSALTVDWKRHRAANSLDEWVLLQSSHHSLGSGTHEMCLYMCWSGVAEDWLWYHTIFLMCLSDFPVEFHTWGFAWRSQQFMLQRSKILLRSSGKRKIMTLNYFSKLLDFVPFYFITVSDILFIPFTFKQRYYFKSNLIHLTGTVTLCWSMGSSLGNQ